MSTTTPKSVVRKQPAEYTNNPLKIAVEGAKLLFQKAPMLALALAILSGVMASNFNFSPPSGAPQDISSASAPEVQAALLGIVVVLAIIFAFGTLVIVSILVGIFSYTAVEVAKGREVSFKMAVKAVFERLWSFVWLQLLTIVKVLLWSLLLIIPGVIMAIRYSLANLSFFDSDKKLTGNAALKDSIALTKGAWLTTFASQTLLDLITLGMITPIAETGSKTMLYRQLNTLRDQKKPKAHALSWVTLGVTIAIFVFVVIFLGYAIVNFGLVTLGK